MTVITRVAGWLLGLLADVLFGRATGETYVSRTRT
jgi:cell shape-determining protein MreD